MQKNKLKFISSLFILSAAFVFLPSGVFAQGTFYNFRSTVLGSGVNQTGQYSYEINNEKTNFSTDESVFFLTRIFNITNVDRFQFKHEIRSNTFSKDVVSPMYYPHRTWWSEIYYWDELGRLPAGNYSIKSYVSVDGGNYSLQRTVSFTVNAAYSYYQSPVQTAYQPAQSYPYYYTQTQNYSFNGAQIGKNIRSTGQYTYDIVDQSTNFRSNEDVYVLAKINNITGIDSFQIKFDVYLNGNSFYKSNEVPAMYPHGQNWAVNNSWANLGKLPAGYHEIRTSIKVNGGSYVQLDSQQIAVDRNINNNNYNNYNNQPCYNRDGSRNGSDNRNGCNYNNTRNRVPTYSFEWTKLNTSVTANGRYDYGMPADKLVFTDKEYVKVLTKISNIKDVDTFRVKQILYRGTTNLNEVVSAEQQPHNSNWAYNYTQGNFGLLDAGSYSVQTLISVNNGAYKLLNTKSFTVNAYRVSTQTPVNYNCNYYNNDGSYNDYYSGNSNCTGYYTCQDQNYSPVYNQAYNQNYNHNSNQYYNPSNNLSYNSYRR